MSYILEALNKSQSARELGEVPRIEGFGVDVPIEVPQARPWAYVGLLAGLIALGAVSFLLLRIIGDAPADDEQAGARLALPAPQLEGSARHEAARDLPVPAAGQVRPSTQEREAAPEPSTAASTPQPTAPRPEAPAVVADTTPSTARPPGSDATSQPMPQPARTPPLTLTDPEDMSVEPQVLVVPAPAAPGKPQPRGADELRRAVLGDGEASVSASVAGSSARDGLPSPPPPEQPLPQRAAPPSERTPVPEDLIAEIEAFKELVRKRQPEGSQRASGPPRLPDPPGLGPPKLERAPPTADTAALPPRPSLDLRNRLPPFSMNVHVYNAEPGRRFVYINGRKLTEGQATPDGIRLERVATDGAVLSFNGQEFFQQR